MKKILIRVGSSIKSSIGGLFITIIAITTAWHGVAWWLAIPINPSVFVSTFILDIILAIILLNRLTYFFAQFVLPIQNQKDRNEIYTRVRDNSSGNRGPAIFIKNGRVIEHESEKGRKGPGVIILDSASAAVLQTDIEYMDTVGPGVKFTKVHKINDEEFNEFVAGSVDLRTQWKFIGPMANDRPFINPPLFPNPTEFLKIHERRQQTSGWTRDGFEVSPTIGIKFRIMRQTNTQTESGVTTKYGYDPDYVRRAIVHKPMELGKMQDVRNLMKWDELPVHIVVNLWREYIRKFKLEDLFTSTDEVSKLQTIEDMINKRVQKPHVVPLDEIGEPLPKDLIESSEYMQLTDRGIEVIEVRIRNVLFLPEIEEKMAEQWSGEWLKNERKKEELLNKREASIDALTRKKAIRKFADISSTKFDQVAVKQDIHTILQDLIEPLREFVTTESRKNAEWDETSKKLESVWKWLLTNKNQPPR